MNIDRSAHPDPEVLRAFGLGKLAPPEIDQVELHIAECQACRDTLKGLNSDTFVELVRRSDDHQVVRQQAVTQAGGQTANMTAELPLSQLPAELANHPRYRIVALLGHGGMGDVYRAEHRLMNRSVALKVIKPQLVDKPGAVERFRREVRAAAKLSHPNVVTAFDAEEAGGVHFLVMEYVEGDELSELIGERGPLPVGLACDYARQVALGLQHAFDSGMVHRDIKPQNLIVDRSGIVKILDFGLASLLQTAAVPSAPTPTDAATGPPDGNSVEQSVAAGQLTTAGVMMGTPDFIAPEQALNASAADIRSDVYALGCTLYFLLAGQPPFPQGAAREKIRAHLQQTPRPLTELNRQVPAELQAVVNQMLAKDPSERYQTPQEVARALLPFTRITASAGNTVWSNFRQFLVVAAAGLLALAVTLILIRDENGVLEIETIERDVKVVLSQGGSQWKLIDLRSGSFVERLPSGHYGVELRDDANLVMTMWSANRTGNPQGAPIDYQRDGFTLTRGGHVVARVERRQKIPAAEDDAEPTPMAAKSPVRLQPGRATANRFDVVLQNAKGLEIEGYVDTGADSFTITSWTDTSGRAWTPKANQLPMNLVAYTVDGNVYDVPSDWDGKVYGFTFLLPANRDVMTVAWNEGVVDHFWGGASFGWGGLRNGLGKVVIAGSERFGTADTRQPRFFEMKRFRYIPSQDNRMADLPIDKVMVTPVTPADPQSVERN